MTLEQIMEQIQTAANEKNPAAYEYWQSELKAYLELQKEATEASLNAERELGAYMEKKAAEEASKSGRKVACRAVGRAAAVAAAAVTGYEIGREVGTSTPYRGGGTIDENVQQAIFIPFWNWWYGYK